MRLLSTPQGKSRIELDNAAQSLRSIQLDEVIRTKRKEIEDLDKSYTNLLSQKGAQNYEEEQLWQEKLRVLNEEVTNLEERKRLALVPLEERVKSIENREGELLKREEIALIKDSDNEHTKEILEDKLDSISEREQEATDYSISLNSREFAIKLQEEQIQQRMKALTSILQESFDEITNTQAEEARRKAVLKGRDISITEREQFVAKQEASFANREKAIADRYRTLLRAIHETNLKK